MAADPMTAGPAAAHQAMAEIGAQLRRQSGVAEPPELAERAIDSAFERFAPQGVGRTDQVGRDAAVAAVEHAAVLDAAVPVLGRRPGESVIRRVLGKTMSWYVGYVAHQVGAFASAEVGALRQLERRLAGLEVRSRATEGLGPAAPPPGQVHQPPARTPAVRASWWHPLALDHLAGVRGRVLHAECGEGDLVRALVSAGTDAYGVDPRPTPHGVDLRPTPHGVDLRPAAHGADPGPAAGPDQPRELDVWNEGALEHLGAVSDGGLAGLVLSGCVERLGAPQFRRLCALAHSKLAPAGRLFLTSTTPEAAEDRLPLPAVELAGGRPLHVEAWHHLLASAGFEVVSTHTNPDSFAIAALRR